MNILLLSFLLSAGAVQNDAPWAMETTLGVEATIAQYVFIDATVTTWEMPRTWDAYMPFESLYTFSAGIRFSGFELGVYHECDHAVDSGILLPSFGAMRTELRASYRASIGVF